MRVGVRMPVMSGVDRDRLGNSRGGRLVNAARERREENRRRNPEIELHRR